ncbi:MAG: hypothetical protein A6D92_18305 [Symbiobacterium thermophilum]|uniref:DUF4213 domain-containing protein n=1 Tax=Symbiobacterium thermophilum TaxID=2734 RepID=A0A1Y2T3M1_SYMTR|nr:MAG: hypothetical protein A6D92_18305 [Symbiobacterium thermophilum]
MTLLERLYEAAAPRLCGKRVQDVRIGSHLVGVLLDSGEFGAAYALPGERQTPEPSSRIRRGTSACRPWSWRRG